ncbi:MAG: ATP phosphoribosyltransferase regulatory subunit, partial [Neisseriaceae bacterium]|nr:ATP phosphoribosyltransferase regulatory subunit [Neisseriaceae bacterium]
IQTSRIKSAIVELEKIIAFFKEYPIYIDLSELRSDRYHTGLLYGIYADGWPNFLAKGGRYNNLGHFFGKARPATGFSLDLKDFLNIIPDEKIDNGIKVSVRDYEPAKKVIEELRNNGEVVIIEYEDTEVNEGITCNRKIELINNEWVINPC